MIFRLRPLKNSTRWAMVVRNPFSQWKIVASASCMTDLATLVFYSLREYSRWR